MPQMHSKSFLVLLATIFLLPIFFIPGAALALESAKTALLVGGLLLTTVIFLFESWKNGTLHLPAHRVLLLAAALPLAYLLSAILSTPSALSLFGYGLEAGTFGYMILGFAMLLLCALVLLDTVRSLKVFSAIFISLSLIALLAGVKIIFGGDFLALGNFFGNMGNPIGNWTDLGMVCALLASFSALVIGMIPMNKVISFLLYLLFLISTALLVIINFQTALIFALITAVLIVIYFSRLERSYEIEIKRNFLAKPIFLPIFLALISVLFLWNPAISGTKLSSAISKRFAIENTEVRPSFSATLDISKAVLSKGAFLGSGPNTFSHDWLIYKPAGLNTTPFWAAVFPFGIGFIPTQIASTGILGSVLWLAFFIFILMLGVRAFSALPPSRAERFTVVASFLGTLFLWGGSFLYAPSDTMLMLAFIFTGLFVAALAQNSLIPTRALDLRSPSRNHLATLLVFLTVLIGAGALGWVGYKKTVAAYHWKNAIDLSASPSASIAMVGNELVKAVNASPADVYYVALSRLYFTLAQAALQATSTPEQSRAAFQDSLSRSIEAAKLSVSLNPAGYQNWLALGTVYSSLVPKPLSVAGAYENAKVAFSEAQKRNPNNPEIYLVLAQLEFSKGDIEAARTDIRTAIALKDDYTDAYLALAELELQDGHTAEAIVSAEKLATLVPNSPGLYFELGVLKYSIKDYQGAEAVLNRALILSPSYANAKYYLGLSLGALGRLDEARMQFEDLARSNPDSPEIRAALDSLNKIKKPAAKH